MTDFPALEFKIKNLPELPGVYRFVDKTGIILYIGKAKNLRRRVSNYFLESKNVSYRIRLMIKKANDIAFTLTNTESEALLLENNLIKQHQPRYNINLKDGKSYPFVCIKSEPYPRVFPTRNRIKDGSFYFGPFANVKAMQAMLDLIRQNFQLRTCNLALTQENIFNKKFKSCLEYQIGNCGAPCEGKVKEADYQLPIEQIKKILTGNIQPILDQLKAEMLLASERYEFEQAERIKKKYEKLHDYRQKSTVYSEKIGNLEVITLMSQQKIAVVNHFSIRNGTIVQTHGFEISKNEDDNNSEILAAVISRITIEENREKIEWISNLEIVADDLPEALKLSIPLRGERKSLIDLSLRNCKNLLEEKIFKKASLTRSPNAEGIAELQRALHLEHLPKHIECFDNSNFQGAFPVASLVVFKNGAQAKKEYRHFKIKTVEGPNDFASMEEVVFRRYKRVLEEKGALPDLIIVDGGKGQLSSAADALKTAGLYGKIPLIGIAKKLEEIFLVNDPHPLHLDKRSAGLKLLQQIRNEAHRFAITFHRDIRSKANKTSALEKVGGIGPVTAKKILLHFGSIKKLKESEKDKRELLLGPKIASTINEAIKKGEL